MNMQYTTLGRTELKVSVVGLGCGGHSRLGTAQGKSMAHGETIVRRALELGVNFIDTAAAYGTEPAVGEVIKGQRDGVVISTKAGIGHSGQLLSATQVQASLENSLHSLGTEYIDVFNLHGVTLDEYDHAIDNILPMLERQKVAGKIRYLGVTEAFIRDPAHDMLQRALVDDLFDVIMVGFNLINPSARHTVFPLTVKNNVATQIMFAVRRALSQPVALAEMVRELVQQGIVTGIDLADPLKFVRDDSQVESIVHAAYRFCRHEPGATVVLTGTGSADHLQSNVDSILSPRLPDEVLMGLEKYFGKVDSVSGN
ncbi:MAG: aryl-alcohol dehydrogenase-like predicted oxidoreductase [Candidatus Azotimanducaceae bacterium]|jgi:aryl-alcohol dehydrogenase-like predicted oxidoreductase